jgi:signal transduction histidine kinase
MKCNDKKTIFLISLFYSNIILKNLDFFNEFPYKNIIIICKHLLLIICLIIALILSEIPGEIFFNLICFEIIFNYGLLILLNKRLVISQNPSNSIEKEKNLIDINEIFYNLNIFYISYNKKNIIFQSKIPKILQIDGKNKFRRLNTFGQKIFKDEIDSLINLFFLKDYKINLKDILDVLLEEKIKVKHLKFNNSSNSFIDESRENARLCVSENPFSFNVNSFLFNRKILKKNILGFTEINDTNNEFNLLGEFLFKERYFNVLYKKEKDILELIITESKIKEIQLKTITITKPDINFEKKIKQKILSKIAHELKTPINSILVFVRNLMQLTNDLKMRKELINIHSISNVVNYLIKDLIFYSNIEKVESNLNYSSISVKETHYNTKLNAYMLFDTLNALLSCYSSKMKYIKTHLIIENTYENYTINIDEILINQIMINFVSNSVKFTRKGHIYILNKFITKMKNSKNMHFLKISIIDSGIGLDENNLKFLFKESIKSDVNQDYNSQGSKLGLSICLNLAKILDIKIEYFSLENIGSIFSLLIPAKKLKNFSNDTLIRTYKIRKSRSQENPRSKLEMDQPTITDSSFSNEIENDIMNRRLLEEFELVEPEIKFKIKETHMEEKHLEFMETDEYIFNLVKSIRKKKFPKKNKYILNNIDISIDNYEYYESNDAYMWKYTYLENENKSDSKVSNDTISTEKFCHSSNNPKEKEYLLNNVKIRQTKTIDFSMINENLCLESQRNYKNYNNNSNLSNNSNENQKGKSNFVKHLFSHRSAKSDQGNSSMSKILSESFEDNSFSEKHSSEIQSFGPKVSYQKCFQKLAKNTINYNNNIDINYSEDINIGKNFINDLKN